MGYGGSMNIWDKTKQYLKDDINKLSPTSTVTIIPFQHVVYPVMAFDKAHFNWDNIEKKFNGYIQNITNTNICSAWDNGVTKLDPNKDNYFFLLTDGNDNVEGMPQVIKRIYNWCNHSKNSYAFYVMLTPMARNPELDKAVKSCKTVFEIDANGHPQPFGAFTPNILRLSTLDLRPRILSFSAAGEYAIQAISNDPLFNVQMMGNIKDGKVIVKVTPKLPISTISQRLKGKDSYTFNAKLKGKGVIILNDTLSVIISNKPERVLNILSEEPDMGKASYYKSFLFCKEKKQDTLSVNLKNIFNQEASKVHSSVILKCSSADGYKGYSVLYNGKICADSLITLQAGTVPGILSIIFNKDSKTGKRHFKLTPVEGSINQLERINDDPAINYELTLRAHYSVITNPLKVALIIAGIIILGLLILWFLFLKHQFYPTIKIGRYTINEPYYSCKKIQGARKVVFCARSKKQNALTKLFKGRIEYEVNAVWTSELVMEPRKRGLSPRTKGKYNIDPYSSILEKNNDYEIENIDTKDKIQITIN